jgi:7-alpha-hydroxysteroid dehydrogenase
MILDQFKLTDKVAIVTGAGHGIGEGTALAYAEAGAHVVCAARTEAEIEDTAEKVRQRGRRALAVPCNIMETELLENLVETTMKEFGRIDILVNNAGGSLPRPALAISERAFEKIVRFNLTCPFLLTRMAVPRMVESAGGGVVVNISSGASQLAVNGFAHYGSAKAGLNQLTRILAAEFAPKVRVNCIIVGQVDTPGASSALSEELRQQSAERIPMRRIGTVNDIATCALYLASPAGSWVTGKVFHVDGGAEAAPLEFETPPL